MSEEQNTLKKSGMPKHRPMTDKEIRALIDNAKAEAARRNSICGSVIEQITCKLPKHHQGPCQA